MVGYALTAAFAANTQQSDALADRVEFQTFEMDGVIQDMMWCGSKHEVILVQTGDGSIYRSKDRGGQWKRLKSLMTSVGQQAADNDQDVSKTISLHICFQIGYVHKMMQSPADDNYVVFLGK